MWNFARNHGLWTNNLLGPVETVARGRARPWFRAGLYSIPTHVKTARNHGRWTKNRLEMDEHGRARPLMFGYISVPISVLI